MTERDIQACGFAQLTAACALSTIAAHHIRAEALQTLLHHVGDDAAARIAVIRACQHHSDAGWWLRHQRSHGTARLVHWAATLGEAVNLATVMKDATHDS